MSALHHSNVVSVLVLSAGLGFAGEPVAADVADPVISSCATLWDCDGLRKSVLKCLHTSERESGDHEPASNTNRLDLLEICADDSEKQNCNREVALSVRRITDCDADAAFEVANLALNRGAESAARRLEMYAAMLGHDLASRTVGARYLVENSDDWDPVAGFVWLRRSAEAGNRDAQAQLAALYLAGLGTPPDRIEGLAWSCVARENGEFQATEKIGGAAGLPNERESKVRRSVLKRLKELNSKYPLAFGTEDMTMDCKFAPLK